jgi:hypothetical protein
MSPSGFTPPPLDSLKPLPKYGPDDVKALVSSAAQRHGVDENLLMRVVQQESSFRPNAVSPKGATGPMQLMPGTAKDLGVDPTNVDQNVEGGARYLSQLLRKYGGDKNKALAAYNAGPGRVDRGGALPAETQNYVAQISGGRSGGRGGASMQQASAFTPPPLSSLKPEKPQEQPKTWGQTVADVGRGAVDLAAGLGAEAMKPIVYGGDLIRRATGQKRIINEPDVQGLMTPPPTAAGRAGSMIEPLLELFLAPELKAPQAATATRAAVKGFPLWLRATTEAMKMGVQAKLHGEDPNSAMILGAASPVVGAGLRAIGRGMSDSAKALYERSLNPTRIITKAETDKVVPELMDKKYWASTFPRYVKQTEEQLTKAAANLKAAWNKVPPGTKVDIQPVRDALLDEMKQYSAPVRPGVRTAITEQAQAARKKILEQYQRLAPFGRYVEAEDARTIRQMLDKAPAKKGEFVLSDAATTALEKAQARGGDALRNELNKIPQIANENAQYHFWKTVDHVVQATKDRKIGQKALITTLATTGILGGDIASGKRDIADIPGVLKDAILIGGAVSLASSTGARQLTAVMANKLGNFIKSRDLTKFFEAAGTAAGVQKARPQTSPWTAPPLP